MAPNEDDSSSSSTESGSTTDSEFENNDIEDAPYFSLEIVGLKVNSNGRQCHLHCCCGESLKVGDVVKLVQTVLNDDQGPQEDAIKAVKIIQGTEGCTVGFLPRAVMTHDIVANHVNKFGIVQVVFEQSRNPYLKKRSEAYCGAAGIVLFDDIPPSYN